MCSTSTTLVGAVEGDADGVEADLGVEREVAVRGHPGGREAADPLLLAAVDREDRALGAEGRALAPGLDLDEDEGAAVAGDDVELAVAGAGVALDDLPAGGGEPAGDQLLGPGTGSLAGDRHRPGTLGSGVTSRAYGAQVVTTLTRTPRNTCAAAA